MIRITKAEDQNLLLRDSLDVFDSLDFVAASRQAKLYYLAARIYTAHNGLVDDEWNRLVELCELPKTIRDDSPWLWDTLLIDKPRLTWSSEKDAYVINWEYYRGVKDSLLRNEVAILGGRDDSPRHPLLASHKAIDYLDLE